MNIIDKNIYNNFIPFRSDISGWNGQSKVFHELIDKTNPTTIIEVGSWKGQSAINMGNYVKSKNLQTTIYCVDTWLGAIEFITTLAFTGERNLLMKNGYPQIYYQFLSNVVNSGLQDIILPIPNTSVNAARYFAHKDIKADMIYIDGSHEYEDVLVDLKMYMPLLKENGIIFGDDYTDWASVKKAVDEFFGDSIKVKEGFWIHEN